MVAYLVLYGSMAALAIWATYWDEDLRWVGFWLGTGCIVSNIFYFSAPLTARPGPYTLIEIMVALAAYCAWASREYRALIAVVAINLLSIMFNIWFAAIGAHPNKYQGEVFVVGTNLCFAAECFLTLGIGVAHGYRIGRFRRRLRLGRFTFEPYASWKIKS